MTETHSVNNEHSLLGLANASLKIADNYHGQARDALSMYWRISTIYWAGTVAFMYFFYEHSGFSNLPSDKRVSLGGNLGWAGFCFTCLPLIIHVMLTFTLYKKHQINICDALRLELQAASYLNQLSIPGSGASEFAHPYTITLEQMKAIDPQKRLKMKYDADNRTELNYSYPLVNLAVSVLFTVSLLLLITSKVEEKPTREAGNDDGFIRIIRGTSNEVKNQSTNTSRDGLSTDENNSRQE